MGTVLGDCWKGSGITWEWILNNPGMDPVWRLDSYWLMLEGLWDSLGTLPGEVWNSFGTISDNFNYHHAII
jgi:hypothetical protein